MNTYHAFEDGYLPVSLWNHVVTWCLPAVHQCLFGLGSPDVRRPPDTGQQTGGTTHRVVTGPGGLLVPGFDWMAGDEQRHRDTHHSEPDCPLHVWIRLRTFYAVERGEFVSCVLGQEQILWFVVCLENFLLLI